MSKVKINEVIKMRNNGCTYREIGEHFGVSKQYVYQLMVRANLHHKPESMKLNPSFKYHSLEVFLKQQYRTLENASRHIGISRSVLVKILQGSKMTRLESVDKIILETGLKYEEIFKEDYIKFSAKG